MFILRILLCISLLIPALSFSEEEPGSSPPKIEEIVVLGGGVAGLTSALYLSRAALDPLVIEGGNLGGALAGASLVYNWPGESEISGSDLIQKIDRQVREHGVRFLQEEIIAINLSHAPFTITTHSLENPEEEHTILAKACVVALGATPRFLGISGEKFYWTKGVYACATCDGGLFKGKTVAVVGGGDHAITDALHLAKIASKVYVFVRKDDFRQGVDNRQKQALLTHPKIEVLYRSEVREISGDEHAMTHILWKSIVTGKQNILSIDGLFLAIGARPNTQLLRGQLELDPSGYVVIKKGQTTSVEGVFAVGDVADPFYKQAIFAAGQGAVAALEAESYLAAMRIGKDLHPMPKRAERAFDEKILNVVHSESEESSFLHASEENSVAELTTKEQFFHLLQQSNHPILLDFYSHHCPPCNRLVPLFQKWALQYGTQIHFLKVNIDLHPDLVAKYQVTATPTLILLDSQRGVVQKQVGMSDIHRMESYLKQQNP